MSMIKRAIRRAPTFLGAERAARYLTGARGGILVFHRVREVGPESFGTRDASVSPARFAAILDALAAAGYAFVGLGEAMRRLRSPSGGRPFVCLTFDDGYRDNLELALPLARARGASLTLFVTTGFVDGSARMWWHGFERLLAAHAEIRFHLGGRPHRLAAATPHEKRRAYQAMADAVMGAAPPEADAMLAELEGRYGIDFRQVAREETVDWAALQALGPESGVEIGAHTVSHPRLAALDPAAAAEEMRASKRRLEGKLGRPAHHFAYPYGDPASAAAREAALCADAGFATACTTQRSALRAEDRERPFALPRITVAAGDTPAAVLLQLSLAGMKQQPARPVRLAWPAWPVRPALALSGADALQCLLG